jgi:hypothetical protein
MMVKIDKKANWTKIKKTYWTKKLIIIKKKKKKKKANCVQKNGLILGPIPKISQIFFFLKKTGYWTGYKPEPAGN